MKLLVPLVIALLGLGAGVGAGLALKPAPEPEHPAEAAAACPEHSETPCEPTATDPFKPVEHAAEIPEGDLTTVAIEKPFVVPIFREEKVVAMVVLSLSLAVGAEESGGHGGAEGLGPVEPRLRDGFLKVMFLHANSGGFDGSFTSGRKIEDLKSALLKSAREIMHGTPVGEVLITEIARQDV